MEKNRFIEQFMGEDKGMISLIYDKIELAKKIEGVTYTELFLPPQIFIKLMELEEQLGVIVETVGLLDESEKKMVGFKSYYAYEDFEFPIRYLEIENLSKFYTLEHRHYLAGILSTGIKREKLGDLIVDKNKCYTIIYSGLFEFLRMNLSSIGKSKIEIKEVGEKAIPSYKFEERDFLITSNRLDAVISAITNLSRNDALKLITSSQVMVNYVINKEKSSSIKRGDIITIRRYGKYVYQGSIGETRKGRMRVKMKKYI
jgi:RNA-binding protein YlmH